MLREVTIKPALNGWIVKVGCQTVVFEKTDDLLHELRRYLEHPDETEEAYQKHALNAKLTSGTNTDVVWRLTDAEARSQS